MKLKKLLIAVSLAAVAALSVSLLFDVNNTDTEPSAEKRGNGGPSLPPVSPSYK